MAKTNAQRQAEYRERHLKDENRTDDRLNTLINIHAKYALARLARHYGITQRALLERLLTETDSKVANSLTGVDQSAYYDG